MNKATSSKITMKKLVTTIGLSLVFGLANAQSKDTDTVNFSFPIQQNADLLEKAPAYSVQSDSYWFETTGEKLNQGLQIPATQSNIALLVSSATSDNSLGQRDATPLNMSAMQLTMASNPNKSVIEHRVSQEQLLQAGMVGTSLALTTQDDMQPGNLMLSTSQPLSPSDQYIVTVKEKDSAFTLDITMEGQSFTQNETVLAKASLSKSGKQMVSAMNAELVAPDGTIRSVDVRKNAAGETVFAMPPADVVIPPIQGLYELRVNTSSLQDGMSVNRNAKVAFAMTNDSGSMRRVILRNRNGLKAVIRIDANTASRFEARGTLYGTNDAGEMVPVMETHTAKNMERGRNRLVMTFDQDILDKANVSAPFELKNVRLYDQQQLGMVDTYPQPVTFNRRLK